MDKVSIITVCFNSVNDISGTIESVINQSYSNLEYIIIDGGSVDGTINVIEKYNKYIDLFISEPDKGIFDAMNKGLKFTTGTWVNFMNAGDTFFDSRVLESVFLNSEYKRIGVIYGNTFSNNLVRKPKPLRFLNYGGIMACHQSIFYNRIICGNFLYYKTKHKFYGDIELTRRLYINNVIFREVNIIISHFQGGGVSSQFSNSARIAKFDYLYQNMGLIGILNGIIGKVFNLIYE